MLDKKTYDDFQEVRRLATERGLSLEEALERAELLLTPQRRHEIVVRATSDLVRRFRRQSASKLMMAYFQGRVEGTAAEMFSAMEQWLDLYLRQLADGTLEEL